MPTALRQTLERSRSLDVDGQLRQCIDQIENIEILVGELLETYHSGAAPSSPALDRPATEEAAVRCEPAAEDFYPGRDLMVPGGDGAFTCLATGVATSPGDPAADPHEGLDYVGVTCDGDAQPVLGAVQSQLDGSAYLLLLRLFCALAESAPPDRLAALDRRHFKGILGPAPAFDLNLVVHAEVDERLTPLAELTRDLAESVRDQLTARRDFPPVLRRIACLSMNPERFDGRLRARWRI